MIDDYNKSSNKIKWLKDNTTGDDGTVEDHHTNYIFSKFSLFGIVVNYFCDDYKINLKQKKGSIRLQHLILKEIDKCMNINITDFTKYILEKHNATSLKNILFPPLVGTPTDIEAITCCVCATNKKDRVLPCGHSYCCVCVDKLSNDCKCPECKTVFDKLRVIKIYL